MGHCAAAVHVGFVLLKLSRELCWKGECPAMISETELIAARVAEGR